MRTGGVGGVGVHLQRPSSLQAGFHSEELGGGQGDRAEDQTEQGVRSRGMGRTAVWSPRGSCFFPSAVGAVCLVSGARFSWLLHFCLSGCLLSTLAPVVKNLPASTGDIGASASIPELGTSPGGGNGNPLQYSPLCPCFQMERGVWRAVAHGVAKSPPRLK